MFNISSSTRIFVCTKSIDMRKSFDGLFSMVRAQLQQDPFDGSLFLFRSKRGNFIKIVWWDMDGFAIFAKKLDIGTFRFPSVRFVDGVSQPVEIDRSHLMLLLEGIDTDSVKRLKRYRRQKQSA
jgi:transposase